MKAIVAVDKKWGIGRNNDLLFSIPDDMKFFRETTKGKIVVMGGTEPAHSTDAVSAILAEYVQADLLVNLTAVDGLYTKDPKKYDDAELIEEITASDMMGIISGNEVKAGTYEFIDTTAIQMIKRSNLETVIANGNDPQNLIRAICHNYV